MNQYDTIGIDCIAMNVTDLICVGAQAVSMVDYNAVEQVARGCSMTSRSGLPKVPSRRGSQFPVDRCITEIDQGHVEAGDTRNLGNVASHLSGTDHAYRAYLHACAFPTSTLRCPRATPPRTIPLLLLDLKHNARMAALDWINPYCGDSSTMLVEPDAPSRGMNSMLTGSIRAPAATR